MSRNRILAVTALGLLMAGPALAQQSEGFYVGAGIGANKASDEDYSTAAGSAKAEYDWDWAGLGSLGYALGNGFRVEGELSHRGADIDKVGGAAGSGELDATALMANLLYDIPTGTAFKPYLGFGLGAVRLNADNVRTVAGSTLDDDDTVLGMQGIAGLGYAITPQLDLFGQYNVMKTQDPEMRLVNGTAVSGDYMSHTFFIGLRYAFNPPAPPPAPAPAAQVAAPAPAPQPAPPPPPPADIVRTYIVFFDWDSAAILPAARDTITQAVENAKKGGVSRLVLTGHADTSGTNRYNQALSERRARNVQAEMQSQGLNSVSYSVQAKGETEPLVPTADGVREPQNRRVEIVLQ